MYARSVIDEKLRVQEQFLGWRPEYHSLDEVDRFNTHIKELELGPREKGGFPTVWSDLYLKRPLTKKETWWMRNERALCKCDANYFKTRYAYICDEEGNVMRYVPRRSQEVFNEIIAEFDEKQLAIELICLKARQQGISTEVQLNFAHRTLFIPGVNAVSSSVNAQKSELMLNMTRTIVEKLPWWLRPQTRKWKLSGNHGMVEFQHGAKVAIQSGAQDTGIAQGWTVTCAHISEVCDFPNPKQLIDEGLLKAVHTSRRVFLVLESTGNGNTGWWADTWRSSKEFYPLGRARLCPVFIPWHMASDLYPKRDWLEKFPVPANYRPSDEARKHAVKCRAYVRNTPILRRILGSDWELPIEQVWYWDFNFQESKRKNAAKEWLRQMPCDDAEALSGKNDTIFGNETIEVLSDSIKHVPIQAYGIIGEGIDEKHEPDPSIVDYDKPRFEVSWVTPKGTLLEWMMVPLKPIDLTEESSSHTKLLVFEEPIPGCDYSFSGDTADGVGEDRSVLNMSRIGPEDGPDMQAAEFCSPNISTAEAAYFMAAIAAWYAPDIPTWRMPLMGIEQRRKPGDDAQNQLIRLGFYRHFRWHRLDGKRPDEEERHSKRLGWYTETWSRPYMFGRTIDAIENGWYIVRSPFAIRELADLEKKYTQTGRSRMEHQEGKHDDRVFGLGIGYCIAHTKDTRIEREKKRYANPKGRLPELDLSPYDPFAFRVS